MNIKTLQMKNTKLIFIKFFFLFLLLFSFGSNAQSTYFEHLQGPNGGRVRCIAINNNGDIYAGLDFGQGLYRSTDNASTWSYVGDVGDNSIVDIKIKPNGEIFVATTYKLYHSTDNGNSWQYLSTAQQYNNSLAINYNNNKIYLSSVSLEYSLNNGSTLIHTSMPASNEIAINSNGVVFTSSNSGAGVYKTSNDGSTYSICPVNSYVVSLVIDSSDIIYAGAYWPFGGIYKSTDNGSTWVQIDSGFINNKIVDLTLNSQGDLYALTESNNFYVRYHNSTNWTPISHSVPGARTIFYDKIHDQILVGSYGDGVYAANDSALTWTKKSYGMTGLFINDMFFTSNNTLYVIADNGSYKSSDLGNTWTELNLPFMSYTSATEDNNGNIFILSEKNGVFKSTDNGNTWAQNDTGFLHTQCFDILADANNSIYLTDVNYGVYKSTDEGSHWLNICSGFSDSSIYSLCLTHYNTLLAGAFMSMPSVYRSTDGGSIWTPDITPNIGTGYAITDFLALNDSTILAINDNYSYYISNDDGQFWSTVNTDDNLNDIIADKNGILYGARDEAILFSSDTGVNWLPYSSPIFADKLAIDSSGIIFAGGIRGVYRSTDSVFYSTNFFKNGLFNFLVFPNPALNQITLDIQQQTVPKNIGVEITNIQGQLIKKLINYENKTTIDISSFPSGIYVFKVKTAKGIMVTKFIKL